MNDHQRDDRINIITHIHTDASTAETSELNDRIINAIHRCDGVDSPIRWTECFTPIGRLERLLERGKGNHGPVHIIVVTDHMRRRSHQLPDRHLAAAARNRRLALGAEFATWTRDVDGHYRQGPEILAYGGPELVDGPHGRYHGLSQALIDELYDTCLDDTGSELCTRRARRLLAERGIVHGLSHPLDGHALSLEATLRIISEFPFIETMNGGYSASSARMLDAFVELNNALLAGGRLPDKALTTAGRRIVEHILRRGRRIHPLSGSDAHSHDFDRVVTTMPPPAGLKPTEVTTDAVLSRMLDLAKNDDSVAASPLVARGKAATPRSLLADVSAIVLRNLRRNLRSLVNPITAMKVIPTTVFITNDELRRRRVIQRRRIRELREDFNPVKLLSQLCWPTVSIAREPERHLARTSRPPGLMPPRSWVACDGSRAGGSPPRAASFAN